MLSVDPVLRVGSSSSKSMSFVSFGSSWSMSSSWSSRGLPNIMLRYLSRVYTLQKMRLRSSNSRYEHPLFETLAGPLLCNPSAVTICIVVPNEYQHSLARDDDSRYRHWPSRAWMVSSRGGPDSREDIYFDAAYQRSLQFLSWAPFLISRDY